MARSAKRREKVAVMDAGFSESEEVFRTWMHEPFLEHMADQRYRERGAYTLGAFLVMRLVDRYVVEAGYNHPEALAYQENSTLEYVLKLDQDDPEVGHLMELIRVSNQVRMGGKRKLLWAPLLAYAYWLEQELRLKEALDVVETAMRMDDGTASEKVVAAFLQQARILRLMGYFDLARESYKDARERAEAMGDTHGVLLSRIGDAIVLRQKGNLPASERALREVLKDAERLGDRDAQARAHHDLGGAILLMHRTTEAVEHLFAAFELYEHWEDKFRALSDLGEALRRQGRYLAARNAFLAVVRRGAPRQVSSRSMISLMEVSALLKDPLEFARWRSEIERIEEELPPEHRADFYLQLGIGYSRFRNVRKAIPALQQALEIAKTWGLETYVALTQRATLDLKKGSIAQPGEPDPAVATEPEAELKRIEEALSELAAA
ncbi:hypothetical protein HRbin33_00815 [bacterium HR33]|nr:hypothetical protein HRbin33_00815 [bacterium HR33]